MTPEEKDYYSRQLRLSGFGAESQERLRRSSVLVIGAGGLGCPAALYLAAAGVGRLTLVDFDRVQISNLHRQILFTMDDLGAFKAEAAARRLGALNPHIEIQYRKERLSPENALRLAEVHDVMVDASDNFETRYLLNDVSLSMNRPLVSAALLGFKGQLAVFNHQGGPCYRCLFPQPPLATPNCAENGVIGALAGVLGAQQAMETIKILVHHASAWRESFLTFDALNAKFSRFHARRDPNCPACGPARRPLESEPKIDVTNLKSWLLERRPLVLIDVRHEEEFSEGAIEGARHVELPLLLSGDLDLAANPSELIIVYCQSGARSRHAAGWLTARGFTNVLELRGGYEAWRARTEAFP